MISGIENVSDVFSIFHDGVIVSNEVIGSNLRIRVRISYLANLISQKYDFFDVTLINIESVSFTTWPSEIDNASWEIVEINEIFEPNLEILSAECVGKAVKVVCNQPSPCLSYCGGELNFSCHQAIVKDPSGAEYSIDQLDSLCKKYWDDWANKGSDV